MYRAVERLPKINTPGAKNRHYIAVGIVPRYTNGEWQWEKWFLHATKGWRKG